VTRLVISTLIENIFMTKITSGIALLLALIYAPAPAAAASLLGPDLASFATFSGTYTSFGAGATMSGGAVGAGTAITMGATAKVGGDLVAGTAITMGAGSTVDGNVNAVTTFTPGGGSSVSGSTTPGASAPDVTSALMQLAAAQNALSQMQTNTVLGVTMTHDTILTPGVYSAGSLSLTDGIRLTLDGGGSANPFWVFNIPTYLVTGANSKVDIINAGAGASVLWNTSQYASLGANSVFLGALLANSYVSQGAWVDFSCGNAFTVEYISSGANANIRSSNCAAVGSWAGSVNGMAANMDIVNGVASARMASVSPVPQPDSYAMLLAGLGLLGFMTRRRKTL
jgi:hypothetical protein